jgi:predicted amidophosphoribosyltransferase
MKYQYPLDESLARFKYHNQRDYAAFYAGQIVKRHGLTLQSLGIDALIPIPIHKRKLEKRGYNQAELSESNEDFLLYKSCTHPEKALLHHSSQSKPAVLFHRG